MEINRARSPVKYKAKYPPGLEPKPKNKPLTTQSAKPLYNNLPKRFNNNNNQTPTTIRPKAVFTSGFSSKSNVGMKISSASRPVASNYKPAQLTTLKQQQPTSSDELSTPITKRTFNDFKKVSRTVDCARMSIRRSIHTLKNVNFADTELKTPSLSKSTFRRSTFRKNLIASGSRIPMLTGEFRKYPSTDEKATSRRVQDNDIVFKKRRSSRRISGLETGCLILTPHLMRQLLKASASKSIKQASNQIDDSILEEEEENVVEIKTIKPSSLLKILLSENKDKSDRECGGKNYNDAQNGLKKDDDKSEQDKIKENVLRKSISNPLKSIDEEISNSICPPSILNQEISKKVETTDMSLVTIRKVLELIPVVKTALTSTATEEEILPPKLTKTPPSETIKAILPLVVAKENQIVPSISIQVAEIPIEPMPVVEQIIQINEEVPVVAITEEFNKNDENVIVENVQNRTELSPEKDDDKVEYIQMTSTSTECNDLESINKSPELKVPEIIKKVSASKKDLIEEMKENLENQNPSASTVTPKKRGRPPKAGNTTEKKSTAKKTITKPLLKEVVQSNEVDSIKNPTTRSKLENKFTDVSTKVVAKEIQTEQEINETDRVLTQKVLTRAQRAKLTKK